MATQKEVNMVTTVISNKAELINLAKYCISEIKHGKLYNFSFEEVQKPKTLKQLSYLFGGLISALQDYYKETGEIYEKEVIKELLYNEIGIDEILQLPNGKKIVYRKSLSKMNKQEAKEFINRCIDWIDLNTECVLPIGLRYLWTIHITDEEIERLLQYDFPEKDDIYLMKLRKMHCLNCGRPATEVHHIREGLFAKGMKNADFMAIPVCEKCHRGIIHQLGEKTFIKGIQNITNGMSIDLFCKLLYQRVRNGYE